MLLPLGVSKSNDKFIEKCQKRITVEENADIIERQKDKASTFPIYSESTEMLIYLFVSSYS